MVLLAGCNRHPDPTVEPEDLPAIPDLQLTRISDEARLTIEQAHERVLQYPGDAMSNGQLGLALHANRRYQEAAVMYDRARKIHPQFFKWEYYRGVALGEINEVAEAGASFQRALERVENEPNALLGLAQVYFKSADLASNAALEDEGDKTLERLIETNPDFVLGYLVKAQRLEEAGELADAAQIYRHLLDKGPVFGAAHQSLAKIYEQQGNAASAERHMALAQQAPSMLPPNQNEWMAEVHRLGVANMDDAVRGQLFLRNRLTGPATQAFEMAVESDPGNVHHRVNLVALYGMAKNLDRAEEHYNAALRLGGADAKVHLNMGTILLGAKRFQEAEQAYNRALAADGTTIKAHLGLARIALMNDDPSRAESFVRQALALEPLNPLVYRELIRALRPQGRLEEAAEAARKGAAYSEGRTAVTLLRTLAALERERGDDAAARAALERARTEAERANNNVDLALIDAQLGAYDNP